MAMPKVDLNRWEFIGSTGKLLVFEDKVFKSQFKLFPVAAVFGGSVGPEPTVWRARSIDISDAAISSLIS